MGLFDIHRELFDESLRDNTVENLYTGFRNLGIDAQVTSRFLAEEEIFGCPSKLFGGARLSIGIIEILQGPIRFVNLMKEWHESGPVFVGGWSYYIQYVVPDPRLGLDSPEMKIKSVRKKTFPLFGRVVDLHWKGNDLGLGIIDRLNSDISIKRMLMHTDDVIIRALNWCFVISKEKMEPPTEEGWNCYQAIAKHLLV